MRCLLMFLAAGVGTSGFAYGQEEPVTTKKHLKVLQPFIGEWVAQMTAEKDSPDGKVKAEESFTVHIEYSWMFDNTAVSFEWFTTNNTGERRDVYAAFYGWNAESKTIVERGIFRRGRLTTNTWKRDGQKWTVAGETIRVDGSRGSTETEFTFVDDNTMTAQLLKRDGQAVDAGRVTFKRK